MATMPKRRAYAGPAIFSHGFRPFFFFGAIYAGAAILVWLPVFAGDLALPTAFAPRDWHVHEMLFGYVAAVVAGFLLTAVPNWTGRLPIQGLPLVILFSVWFAGRIAVCASAWIGWAAAGAIDALFLSLLAVAAAREIIAGRKWNNLKVVGIVCLLASTNIAFHLEAHFRGNAEYSARASIALVVVLIGLIGGRIVPSFTRNWLARQAPGRLPAPFGRFDVLAMLVGGGALLAWVIVPVGRPIAIALFIAGLLHLVRLGRWAGYRTVPDRLVLILHLAYAFVPVGFILSSLSALELIAASAGVHAWTGGAIGSMTIAVMTRASLGHTGQPLSASAATQGVYAAVIAAAVVRVCAALEPNLMPTLLPIAGIAWAVAFLGFAMIYARLLCAPRAA